jgi:hypothetical protein
MAEKQGNYEVKRGNYFQGMMLVDSDFTNEQSYHRQMRHNHNLEMHTWGVARGLVVSSGAGGAVSVSEGLAIDANGREIWWKGGDPQVTGSASEGSYLVIEWSEELRDDYPQMAGMKLRVLDTAKFSWKRAKEENDLVLAQWSQGRPDNNPRRYVGGVRANQNDIEIRPVTKDGSLRLMTGAPLKEGLTIDSAGNVGIGTTAPGPSKLKISKSATDSIDFRFQQDGAGQLLIVGWLGGWNINTKTNDKHLYLNRDAQESSNVLIGRDTKELFVRGRDGNVGIGTNTPGDSYKLEVAGKIRASGFDGPGGGLTGINAASITGKLTAAQIPDLKDIAGQLPATKINDQWTKTGANIYFGSHESGNVGIGTNDPKAKLQIEGGSLHIKGEKTGLIVDNQDTGRVGFIKYEGREAGIWRLSAQRFEIGRVDSKFTALPGTPTGWTSDLYIGSDGRVGIGKTTDLDEKLNVDGSIKASGSIKVNGDVISRGTNTILSGHVFWRPYAADNTVYFHAWAEDPKPRDTRFAFRVRGDGDSPGITKGYGIVVIDKDGIWGNHKGTSDIRLKKDVSFLSNQTNPTEKLLSLHGIRFRWENATDDGPYELGLIAQEVERVFPELVSTSGDGFKGISVLGMFAPVIEAIREQRDEIEELRAEISKLRER